MPDVETTMLKDDTRIYLVGQILSGLLARPDTKVHLIPEMIKKAFDIADEAIVTNAARPKPN